MNARSAIDLIGHAKIEKANGEFFKLWLVGQTKEQQFSTFDPEDAAAVSELEQFLRQGGRILGTLGTKRQGRTKLAVTATALPEFGGDPHVRGELLKIAQFAIAQV
jgi:hypothetical protein